MTLYKNFAIQTDIKEDLQTNRVSDKTNKSVEELMKIFKKHGTDKYFHKYFNFYGKFIGPKRYEKLELLEIGLGCGMFYGPGKSLLSWSEFLPNSKISILEYNRDCALKFKNITKNLFMGSQSDFKILKQVEAGSPYDIIIDDGGHTRSQQVNSLIGLFPYLKKGGIYIIEDLYYSFSSEGFDSNRSAFDVLTRLIMHQNNPIFRYDPVPGYKLNKIPQYNFETEPDLKYLIENVEYVVCFWHACAFFKINI